jgi:hypothetical protein
MGDAATVARQSSYGGTVPQCGALLNPFIYFDIAHDSGLPLIRFFVFA